MQCKVADLLLSLKDSASKKDPFKQYSDLEQQGAKIVWGDPSDTNSIPEGPFEIVYDNNGKSLETCQPLIDKFKVGKPVPSESHMLLVWTG